MKKKVKDVYVLTGVRGKVASTATDKTVSVVFDYNSKGQIVGVEILGAKEVRINGKKIEIKPIEVKHTDD